MKKIFALAIILLGLSLAGCPRNVYNVNIKTKDGTVERKMVCCRRDGDKHEVFPPEILEQLDKAYGKHDSDKTTLEHKFEGEFKNIMPSDVISKGCSNSGHLEAVKDDMGTLTAYAERMPETLEPSEYYEKVSKAADASAEILENWFKAEMGENDAHFKKFAEFLAKDFKKDFKNMLIQAWIYSVLEQYKVTSCQKELAARIGHMLCSKGYLKPGELPKLLSPLTYQGGDKDSEEWMGLIQRMAARKMGIDDKEPLPESLAFLKTNASAKSSFEKNIKDVKKYDKVFENVLVFDIFPVDDDEAGIYFESDIKPVLSNGDWKEKGVEWKVKVGSKKGIAPLCFAVWASPDEVFQKKHFGKVVLEGGKLAEYIFFSKTLAETDGKRWKAFISGLSPDDDVLQDIKDFRFIQPEGNQIGKADPSDRLRELLIKEMEPPKE